MRKSDLEWDLIVARQEIADLGHEVSRSRAETVWYQCRFTRMKPARELILLGAANLREDAEAWKIKTGADVEHYNELIANAKLLEQTAEALFGDYRQF